MCAADEAFFLGPPRHIKEEWLPDRASTRLFQALKKNAPAGVIPDGPTVQGVYCMTADGDYLSGYFARASRDKAKRVIEDGWARWEQIARERGYRPKPVPRDPLDFSPGKPVPAGGLRLEVAVRDLPRGRDPKPVREESAHGRFNLNWLDLTADEARSFITDRAEKQPVPAAVLEKVALKTLKDAVRGQCADWEPGDLREGRLDTERVERVGDRWAMRLTGSVRLDGSGRTYTGRLHGRAVYDTRSGRIVAFELVTVGQRAGRDQFNFRTGDSGPAPMGVACIHHEPRPEAGPRK